MAQDYDTDSLRDRFDDRRDRINSFQKDLDTILDKDCYNAPETEDSERQQREWIRSDLYKLEDRIANFRSELE
jgi:heme oxygenase